jgi:hypothetical protein
VDPDSRRTGTAGRNVLSAVTRTGLKEESFELPDKITSMYIEANNLNLQLSNVSNMNSNMNIGTSQRTVQEES